MSEIMSSVASAPPRSLSGVLGLAERQVVLDVLSKLASDLSDIRAGLEGVTTSPGDMDVVFDLPTSVYRARLAVTVFQLRVAVADIEKLLNKVVELCGANVLPNAGSDLESGGDNRLLGHHDSPIHDDDHNDLVAWLRDFLATEKRHANDIFKQANLIGGWSRDQVKRAKKAAGAQSVKIGEAWWWEQKKERSSAPSKGAAHTPSDLQGTSSVFDSSGAGTPDGPSIGGDGARAGDDSSASPAQSSSYRGFVALLKISRGRVTELLKDIDALLDFTAEADA